MQPIPLPYKANFETSVGNHYVFVVEPLYPGYGTTIGNALRRVLLNSIPGAAVIAFKIRGVDHEFSTIPGVREDVIEMILNLKQLRLKVFSAEPVTLLLHAKGPGPVKAAQFEPNDQVQIISEDLTIATLDDKKNELEMEVIVQQGRGYVPVEQREGERAEIGLIQVDAVYSPIRSVSYDIENVRVGQMTNYDKLALTIDTDGSITGQEALDFASRILLDHFTVMLEGVATPSLIGGHSMPQTAASSAQVSESKQEEPVAAPVVETSAEEDLKNLNLSSRSLNALRKNGINTVSDLKKYSSEELSKLEGLGSKSVNEIIEALNR